MVRLALMRNDNLFGLAKQVFRAPLGNRTSTLCTRRGRRRSLLKERGEVSYFSTFYEGVKRYEDF